MVLVEVVVRGENVQWHKWPVNYRNDRIEVPDGWYTFFIDNAYFVNPSMQHHYGKFDEILKWVYSLPNSWDNMLWDIDNDQMYFGFKHEADKTLFVLRWA